jgi:hypothetical protein
MTKTLFKYVTASTAVKILEGKTLLWSAPDSFNDPFELKSPFEYGFEWEDLREPLLQWISDRITEPYPPKLAENNVYASMILAARKMRWGGGDPAKAQAMFEPEYVKLRDRLSKDDELLRETWQKIKQTYRILCLSAVHDNILMWSHYAEFHRGAVLEFRSVKGLNTPILFAHPVSYSASVPVAATLEEFLGHIVGEKPRPVTSQPLRKSLYTKSSAWSYEEEWRILDKVADDDDKPLFKNFHPEELAAVYFGCRLNQELKESIMRLISTWPTDVKLFQMRDQRVRFELKTELL